MGDPSRPVTAPPTATPATGRPLLVEPIRARAAYHAENGKLEELYRDEQFLEDVARLDLLKPAEAEAIKATISKIKGFKPGAFKKAVEPFRDSARAKESLKSAQKVQTPRDGSDLDPETMALLEIAQTVSYEVKVGHVFLIKLDKESLEEIPEHLADFSAEIAEEIDTDDGSGTIRKLYRVTARSAANPGTPVTIDIPASEFAEMKWPEERLGAEFRIESGRGFRDHVRSAIMLHSEPVKRTVFGHVGWRKIGVRWGYLHAGGAIFADGNDESVAVQLEGAVSRYRLPDPPQGQRLIEAVRASLGMLNLGDESRPGAVEATSCLFATTFSAAIEYTPHTIQVYGATSSLKSSHWALAQQHFGAGMNGDNLPASWVTNTYLSILQAAGMIHDAVFVVDDFIPRGTPQEIRRKHGELQEFFQAVGNHQGRNRLAQDGSPRPGVPPGCSPVSTGEDQTYGGSADARTIAIRYTRETIDKVKLKVCQEHADRGVYAESMAGFIRWLAPQLDDVRAEMRSRIPTLRDEIYVEGDHGRTPQMVARLIFGAEVFLRFAKEVGAIDEEQRLEDLKFVREGLISAAGEMRTNRQEELDPADLFLSLVRSAMTRGTAFVCVLPARLPESVWLIW
jgi:hypothetical protein